MTLDQLRARFPHASDAFLRKNAQALETLTPGQIKDACMRLNLGLIPPGTEVSTTGAPVVVGKTGVKRLRQSQKRLLNKLETEFGARLCVAFPYATFRAQAKTYRLANGVRYSPDFTAILDGVEHAWEVKGKHAWDDALVKLKVAAAAWPEIVFVLAWKENGEWREQRILA